MAAIDYATCGINDVIAHSLKLHPQPLADRLRFHARVHAQFADAYNDSEVMRNELDLADRLHSFAAAVELGDHTIPGDFDVRREAFSCAACQQDLHPIMQNLIAEREQADALWAGAAELPQQANDGRHTGTTSLQQSVSAAQSARGKAAQFLRHDLA